MTKFVNLTPHTVNVRTLSGKTVEITSSGVVRCSQKTVVANTLPLDGNDDITITRVTLGEVEGLPEAKDGVIYIVSRPVAEKMKGLRNDLLIPGPLIRDEAGRVVACDGLSEI